MTLRSTEKMKAASKSAGRFVSTRERKKKRKKECDAEDMRPATHYCASRKRSEKGTWLPNISTTQSSTKSKKDEDFDETLGLATSCLIDFHEEVVDQRPTGSEDREFWTLNGIPMDVTNIDNEIESDDDSRPIQDVPPGKINNPTTLPSVYHNYSKTSQNRSFSGSGLPSIPGRRIVDLGALAAGLSACTFCSKTLDLFWTKNEKRLGLASVLRISCKHCGRENTVHTSTRHVQVMSSTKNGSLKRRQFVPDINTKCALGK